MDLKEYAYENNIDFINANHYTLNNPSDIELINSLNIDVAFVCMNLPYTMDVDQAADGVLDFAPKVVYPYHYRGKGGLSDIDKFKALVTTMCEDDT